MRKIFTLYLMAGLCIGIIGIINAPSKEEKNSLPEGSAILKKVEIDVNKDGIADSLESYNEKGILVTVENDANQDGQPDEWLYYEKGNLVKAAKDTNRDGRQDVWLTY